MKILFYLVSMMSVTSAAFCAIIVEAPSSGLGEGIRSFGQSIGQGLQQRRANQQQAYTPPPPSQQQYSSQPQTHVSPDGCGGYRWSEGGKTHHMMPDGCGGYYVR